MQRLRQGFQTQTPLNGTPPPPFRRETVPVSKMHETILPQRILQSTHKSQIFLLQTESKLKKETERVTHIKGELYQMKNIPELENQTKSKNLCFKL